MRMDKFEEISNLGNGREHPYCPDEMNYKWQIRINQLPDLAARRQHGSQICFATFIL